MTGRNESLAEVVSFDKHKRLTYNANLLDALVRNGLWRFDPSEFMVFMYLMAHTVFVGKTQITLPLRVMLEGVFDDATGEWLQVPIPLSKKTVMGALSRLAKQGVVRIIKNKVIPGHGVLKAASTIEIGMDVLTRYMAESEATRGKAIPYSTAGVVPVVPTPE